jgi:sulfur carrier protein
MVFAMKVNGESVPLLKKGMSLKDFLCGRGYNLALVAVERNGEIASKRAFEEILLSDDDTLEIVSFVGGG